ncbi:triple functional domain protein-like [Stigmatopora argus]
MCNPSDNPLDSYRISEIPRNILECRERKSELQVSLEVMLNISKTTNDAMHLLGGWFDESIKEELLLEESFKVWNSKSPFQMGPKRYLFLLEKTLVFCKVAKDTKGN